jgi:hypothetical protein
MARAHRGGTLGKHLRQVAAQEKAAAKRARRRKTKRQGGATTVGSRRHLETRGTPLFDD